MESKLPGTASRSSRGTTTGRVTTSPLHTRMLASDNRRLDSRNWERLDHGFGWLGLDHDCLAEHFPLASLRRRLEAGLDAAHARNNELPCTLHLLRSDAC